MLFCLYPHAEKRYSIHTLLTYAMTILDNITNLLGDDLKQRLQNGGKMRIAASCFSIYAYETLKKEYPETRPPRTFLDKLLGLL
jgi:hypothetical protein